MAVWPLHSDMREGAINHSTHSRMRTHRQSSQGRDHLRVPLQMPSFCDVCDVNDGKLPPERSSLSTNGLCEKSSTSYSSPDASKAQPEPQPEASIFALEVGAAAAAAVELDHPLYNNGEVSEGGEGGRLLAGGRGGRRCRRRRRRRRHMAVFDLRVSIGILFLFHCRSPVVRHPKTQSLSRSAHFAP